MGDICRQQCHHYSTRNIFSNMEAYSILIQSYWSHFTRNWAFNIPTIYAMVVGTNRSSQELLSWPTTEVNNTNSAVYNLIVSAEHIRLVHVGPRLLCSLLHQKYWIPGIRNLVNTVIHRCLTSSKLKAQATQQLMGKLLSTRVQPSIPFSTQEWLMQDQFPSEWNTP